MLISGSRQGVGLVPATVQVAGHPLSSDVILAKGDVGLDNADNTSDADKPISDATAEALDSKVESSSNAGLTGVGLTLRKDGTDLPFRSIEGDGATILVDEDAPNHAIKISYIGPSVTMAQVAYAATMRG